MCRSKSQANCTWLKTVPALVRSSNEIFWSESSEPVAPRWVYWRSLFPIATCLRENVILEPAHEALSSFILILRRLFRTKKFHVHVSAIQ